MSRLLFFATIVCAPTLAFAAAGGEQGTASLILSAVSVALQGYMASVVPVLRRRVAALEQRFKELDEEILR